MKVELPGWLGSRRWCYTRAGLWVSDVAHIKGDAVWHDHIASASKTAVTHTANEGDVGELRRVSGLSRQRIAGRMALGKRCYVAEVDGNVVSYGWISVGCEEIPELERTVHLSHGEAYIWDCFTVPAFRGMGLLPVILRKMVIDLRRSGFQRAWAVILATNIASQRAFQRAGFTRACDILYLRLLGLRYRRLVCRTPPNLRAAADRLFC